MDFTIRPELTKQEAVALVNAIDPYAAQPDFLVSAQKKVHEAFVAELDAQLAATRRMLVSQGLAR